jgi:hypothetical protein
MTVLSFGLTAENLEFRRNSIGASDARIIVNGTDEEITLLWQIKRGEAPPLDLDGNIYCQFGQYAEGFHRNWFERRTGLDVSRCGEEVTHPDYPGMHVTLDGFVKGVPPVVFQDPDADFKFSWGCTRPSGLIDAVFEMKWRNARQFDLAEQVATFGPQIHQGMAMTETEFSILSTFISDLVIHARVIPFDNAYWAQCLMRIDDFREAVAANRAPTKFPKLKSMPGAGAEVKIALRTVDMMKTPKANLWNSWAQTMLATAPTPEEKGRASDHEKAKTQLKKLIDKDMGICRGAGIEAKKNAAGSISFTMDEEALATAQKQAKELAEAMAKEGAEAPAA